jgi:C4-dicarboxylate transporter
MVFAAIGSYTAFPTLVTWHANNLAGQAKRAAGMAIQIGIGNLGGAMAANFYRAKDAPHYRLGHGLEIMFIVLASISGVCVLIYYTRQNSKREKEVREGVYDNWTLEQLNALGDKSPYFRYRL